MNLFNNKQRTANKISKYVDEINAIKTVIMYWNEADTITELNMNNKNDDEIRYFHILDYLSYDELKQMVLYNAQYSINYYQNKINKLVK